MISIWDDPYLSMFVQVRWGDHCKEKKKIKEQFYSKYYIPFLTHGHHQMVNTEIRLIVFFAAKDEETLYSQQKQDRKLTVAQIMNTLLPDSNLNWRK